MNNKYLYISDLDGTLLNSNKQISECSKQALNALINKGVYFSIATARTATSAVKILSGLQLNVPIILMNGVAIYDIYSEKYINIENIIVETAYEIVKILRKYNVTGFMYGIANDKVSIYYESLATVALQKYHDEHVINYGGNFTPVTSFADVIKEQEVIYFTLMGEQAELAVVVADLNTLQGIDAMLSSDVYIKKLWYLELHSTTASKYNAVQYLRKAYDFDKIIGFGDNYNDIPLYQACDDFFAVDNAINELKDRATGVIGDNNSDSVAKFIVAREEFPRLY
jgi:Cof subfamily protein (haloacid dehalogenase superfamily)